MATSVFLLIVGLTAVVLLSKQFSALIDQSLGRLGAPSAATGILVALLILLPESVTAVRAALRNRLQQSLNLALGSSLATIGLTIPAVSAVAILTHRPLTLGLAGKDAVLLALTLVSVLVTLGSGRTTILNGVVHLVMFAAYLFLVFVP